MIILYDANCEDFNNNGIGILKDTLKCEVTEDLNGELVLDMEYPITSKYIEYIVNENIIKCDAGLEEEQLFRIKNVKPNLDTIIVYAEHISYDLADNYLEDVFPQNMNGAGCLDWILSHTLYKHRFTSFSDIQKTSSARYVRKNPIEAIIGDLDNSFVNLWGGELERNNFLIKMLTKRGNNNGYKIKYRKNLTGLDFTIDNSNIVTKIMPQGYNGLFLPEKYIDSPLIENYPHPKVQLIEFSDVKVKENEDDEDGYATEEEAYQELRRLCNLKYSEENIDKPTVNLKVDFVDLSQTTEYQNYTFLERVQMGDTVTVELDYTQVEVRVIKTTYDSLLHRYTKLELGEFKANYITDSQKDITNTIRKETDTIETSILAQAKQNATEQLTAALGGYIYKTQNELFIMDTDNPNTSKKVWRWNLNGLGYSKNGINGPYELAMTQDGRIVADFIKAGQMDVARIKGLETLSIVASQLHLEGYTTINDGFSIDEEGNMSCNKAKINGGSIRLEGGTRSNPQFEVWGEDESGNTTLGLFIPDYINIETILNANISDESVGTMSASMCANKTTAAIYGSSKNFGTHLSSYEDRAYLNIDDFNSDREIMAIIQNAVEIFLKDGSNNCCIYPDNIYINGKNCVVSHGGIISMGFVYYTNGSATNYGYVELLTTDRGAIGVNAWQSDGRLKKDIKPTEVNALNVINSILHRTFKWKENDGIEEIGYIAQELEEIKENFVIKIPQRDENGNVIDESYQINETKIIPYITKAIQELSSEIEEQKKINNFLLKKLNLEKEYKSSNTISNIVNSIKDKTQETIKQYDDNVKYTKIKIKEKFERYKTIKNSNGDIEVVEEVEDEKIN